MPIFKDFNLCFIHIPKTAGTSVLDFIGNENVELFSLSLDYTKAVYPQHYHLSEIYETFPEVVNCEIFTVVRNPYDRLISAFHYAKEFYWAKGLTFEDFVRKSLSLDIKSRRFIFSGHLDLQSDYLDINLGVNINIFKYENLNGLIQYLRTKTEKIEDFPRSNKSNRSKDIKKYYENTLLKDIVLKFYEKDFYLFDYDTFL